MGSSIMDLVIVITSRASYSRVRTVIRSIHDSGIDYGIICAATATEDMYGDIASLIQSDGFNVTKKIKSQLLSTCFLSTTKVTALGILSISEYLDEVKPLMVITVADRYETIGTAISAAFQNIKLVHIQGGERTGNIDDKVRDAVSVMSDIHFPGTEKAANRLRRFVKDPNLVFNFGCPSIDLFLEAGWYSKSETLESCFRDVVTSNQRSIDEYFVVMMHPETNSIEECCSFTERFLSSVEGSLYDFIWFWPNADAGSDRLSKILRCHDKANKGHVRFIKNVRSELFVNLLRHSKGLIGNSSVGVRETGILGMQTVDVGCRQRNRERHNNCTNVDYDASFDSIMKLFGDDKKVVCSKYGNGDAGEQIGKKVVSFIEEEKAIRAADYRIMADS